MSLLSVDFIQALNAVFDFVVAGLALLVALKMRRDRTCPYVPLLFLSGTFMLLGIVYSLWALDTVSVSVIDNLFIAPLFNLVILSVWFYLVVGLTGHRNIYYLIAVLLMGANAALVFTDLAMVADVLIGLSLIALFFHVGLVRQSFARLSSYLGMAYGAALAGTSVVSSLSGLEYTSAPWFIANIALLGLLFIIYRQGNLVLMHSVGHKHRIPVVVEVIRLGFFVCSFSVFLMLGMLGVHEMGHSLAAGMLGCEHQTSYGIGYGVTAVKCDAPANEVILLLSGFVMTLLISGLIFAVGNDFARRIAYLMFGTSLVIATDDFSMLGLPGSGFIIVVFCAAVLLIYGVMLVVREYETEYIGTGDLAPASAEVRFR